MATNPLTEYLAKALEGDQAVSDAMRVKAEKLAEQVMDHAINDFEFADDQTKALLTKTLLPSVIRSLGMDSEEDDFEKAKSEFVEVLAACVGVGAEEDEEDDDDGDALEAIVDEDDDYEEATSGVPE